ncbi:hypothetical protein [Rhodanobacter sp. B04]|uniref:hypothetical protein n=1 Tax=Rhodanobacter sp. B04 TaxID=1945860 RepID=UPI0020C54E2C|nr:hypothetical protein [Rhodanobacter sp. B04]
MLAIGIAVAGVAHGLGSGANRGARTEQLSFQVNDDRMTVSVAGRPQVYLYGVIDADAPQRFEALVRSGKIPAGSDIYLNSPSGDLAAGLALGRLFRASSMATHLGTPRRTGRAGYQGIKAAFCTGACAYAYFGGLYRWAPTGNDHIGLTRDHVQAATSSGSPLAEPAAGELDAYLKDMGIEPGRLAAMLTSAADSPVWLSADQMTASGLANNGRLPLTAKTVLLPPMPSLELDQDDRSGSHRLVLQCRPGNVTLTAYDFVGKTRAREIVSRATRSYFEVNQQEVLTEQHDGASVVDGAVVITRPYPPTELVDLLSAQTIGAWVGGRTSAFRDGFAIKLYPARDAIKDYYEACWRVAPWPARQKTAKHG